MNTQAQAPVTVEGNRIIYPTHIVVADAEILAGFGSAEDQRSYMVEMANSLSETGTAHQHLLRLEALNNDGTWSIDFTPAQRKELKPLADDFIKHMGYDDHESYVEWERLTLKIEQMLGCPKLCTNPIWDGDLLIIIIYEAADDDEFLETIQF